VLGRHVRPAVRPLRSRPGFAATAVIILAAAIGATTTIFSLVFAVLLRPLPFPRGLISIAYYVSIHRLT
jgi:hypothetical protein